MPFLTTEQSPHLKKTKQEYSIVKWLIEKKLKFKTLVQISKLYTAATTGI